MAKDELLKVKIKKGTFYLSSKTDEGEGWERQEFTLKDKNGNDEKMVRWHKELSLKGTVQWMDFQKGYKDIEQFAMIIKGDDGNGYALQIPVIDSGGKVETTNDYFNSIAGVVSQLKKGDKVTMFLNNKNKDKNDRLYRNIVVLDGDEKLIKNDFNFKDVPKWSYEITKDFKGEETKKWDATEANAFYYMKVKDAIENFGNNSKSEPSNDSNEPQPKQESKGQEQKVNTEVDLSDDEYDDLPF